MSSIRTFEDLLAWQRAMDLAEHVYEAASHPPFAGDRSLTKLRAMVAQQRNQPRVPRAASRVP